MMAWTKVEMRVGWTACYLELMKDARSGDLRVDLKAVRSEVMMAVATGCSMAETKELMKVGTLAWLR